MTDKIAALSAALFRGVGSVGPIVAAIKQEARTRSAKAAEKARPNPHQQEDKANG